MGNGADQLEKLILEMLYLAGDIGDVRTARVLRTAAEVLTVMMNELRKGEAH